MKKSLFSKLVAVEKIANGSKFKRLFYASYKYSFALLHRLLLYTYQKKSKEVQTANFFNEKMTIRLPAATDIYLTGGKTHSSEIKLAKFLIQQLKEGDCFIDIGAHYGYFTLLGATLVGSKGQVLSFEAAPNTYGVLRKNVQNHPTITALNKAISNSSESITFFEFPNLYSEYNSMDIQQFEQEEWITKYPPKKHIIEAIDLSTFITESKCHPSIIKIDVEGAEYKVIQGASSYLQQHRPMIVMEYLSPERGNTPHSAAVQLLNKLGFDAYTIDNNGLLKKEEALDSFLKIHQLDSDNVVFLKREVSRKY